MFNTILVSSDLSPASRAAFPIVAELARSVNAKVLLVSVVELIPPAQLLISGEFELLPDAQARDATLQKVTQSLTQFRTAHFADLSCELIVHEATGPVHREILSVAKEHAATLICIASHGRTGLPHLLLGSTAERLMREAHCPVLVVPARQKE